MVVVCINPYWVFIDYKRGYINSFWDYGRQGEVTDAGGGLARIAYLQVGDGLRGVWGDGLTSCQGPLLGEAFQMNDLVEKECLQVKGA